MHATSTASANAVWFLIGPFDSTETVRYSPIYSVPFSIGRRQDLSLSLSCKTVSSVHAEIIEAGESLVLRDLGSTNGTYVNGTRITGSVSLHEDDLVQFANMPFRVRLQTAHHNTHTVKENVCDGALALVQFDKLMSDRAVTPYFQPIVSLAKNNEVFGYEVLGRSRLFGLEMPKDMFRVATQLNLEIELSKMLRWEGIQAGQTLDSPHLFVNTHPRELAEPGLLASLQALREAYSSQPLTLEIHESAVTDGARMAEIRAALAELNIGLAYDDFGAGQARLNELVESPPDYLKFDMSLIRDIDAASTQRQQLLASLVQMVRKLGIVALAEGIETEAESQTCVQMGFDLAQGYFHGRPVPPSKLQPPA